MAKSRLSGMGYPHKLYLLGLLLISSAINLKMLYDLWIPSGRQPYLFIFWNFFLAWLPVVFMLGLDLASVVKQRVTRIALMVPLFLLWLFFYPNAAYLVTDLLHVFANYEIDLNQRFWGNIAFWRHVLTLFMVGLNGLALGAVALSSVQNLVRKRLGSLVSWLFAAGVLLLSSFGVYAGRFMRWNSWDLATIPSTLVREFSDLFASREHIVHMVSFCAMYFLMTLFVQLFLALFARIRFEPDRSAK